MMIRYFLVLVLVTVLGKLYKAPPGQAPQRRQCVKRVLCLDSIWDAVEGAWKWRDSDGRLAPGPPPGLDN